MLVRAELPVASYKYEVVRIFVRVRKRCDRKAVGGEEALNIVCCSWRKEDTASRGVLTYIVNTEQVIQVESQAVNPFEFCYAIYNPKSVKTKSCQCNIQGVNKLTGEGWNREPKAAQIAKRGTTVSLGPGRC